jgi:superoxide dismutase, Fe-Mn family
VLHELYFQNLTKARTKSGGNSAFRQAAEASFGSYDIWKADFVGIGKMRGVGWAMCYQDPTNHWLSNHWITLHEVGNVTGFIPILVMDVWEHAYLLDYKPSERAQYIEAFFANIDWDTIDKRVGQAAARWVA